MADVDPNELERYLRLFQENPDSRVFAPLADLFRRLKKFQEAEEVCREGLKRHPYYAGGKVALAQIFFETGRVDQALEEVESVVTYYPDNLLARKILVKALASLGHRERALREFEALKALAPMIASDPEIQRFIQVAISSPQTVALKINPGPPVRHSNSPKPIEIQEKTEWDPKSDATAIQRRNRIAELTRKKMILETWIRTLGSSKTLS